MKNGTELSSEALTTEIKHLNETSNNAYEGAKNYYDIALKNVQSSSTHVLTSSIETPSNNTSPEDEPLTKETLEAFYDIHQRSQITGVSTQEYNQALTKIGIDTTDSFAAIKGINLLQSYG